MPAVSGFQTNTTIHAAFWRYVPDPAAIPPGKTIYVEMNGIQFIEASTDRKSVYLYYAANNVSTSQEPYKLTGDVAEQFLADLEALFT